jgi:hypothetical protein
VAHRREHNQPKFTLTELSDLSSVMSVSSGPVEEDSESDSLSDASCDTFSSLLSSLNDSSTDSDANLSSGDEMDDRQHHLERLSDSEDSNDSDDSSFSGDADDEDGSGTEEEDGDGGGVRHGMGHWVRKEIESMYAHRYELPRDKLLRGPAYLRHVLTTLKDLRPDMFRQELRVSPATFDKILAKIADNPVFFNNSNNPQLAVEDQLAIVLYRFGHDGNAASLQSVANWAGVGKGTVTLCTRRVMTAVLHPRFMKEAVRFPTDAEKLEAKDWVQAHSCKAWNGGWLFVDGTLVPLCDRPYWFGESYFDRKCNYSLNVQVCTTFPHKAT